MLVPGSVSFTAMTMNGRCQLVPPVSQSLHGSRYCPRFRVQIGVSAATAQETSVAACLARRSARATSSVALPSCEAVPTVITSLASESALRTSSSSTAAASSARGIMTPSFSRP